MRTVSGCLVHHSKAKGRPALREFGIWPPSWPPSACCYSQYPCAVMFRPHARTRPPVRHCSAVGWWGTAWPTVALPS